MGVTGILFKGLALGDSHPHTSILLRHGNEHIMVVRDIFLSRIR
jgi:hypothetical protein